VADTLTVTVDDGGTYTVDVRGVDLCTDAGLTTPATFPTSVSAQTTWYAAAPSGPGRRPSIEVVATAANGTQVPIRTLNSLPATVSASDGTVDFSAPTTGGSSAGSVGLLDSGGGGWYDSSPGCEIPGPNPNDVDNRVHVTMAWTARINAGQPMTFSLSNLSDELLASWGVHDFLVFFTNADGSERISVEGGNDDPCVEGMSLPVSGSVNYSTGTDLSFDELAQVTSAAGGTYSGYCQLILQKLA